MNNATLQTLGQIPIITAWDYFWDMLPYAVPGFISFVTGIFLTLICVLRYLRESKGARNPMYREAALMLMGFGTFGLMFALRATVRDEALLFRCNNYLQGVASLGPAGVAGFLYHFLGKQYRPLKIIYWLLLGFAFLGFILGSQNAWFKNEWLNFVFGKYPKSSITARIWAAVGTLSVLYATIILIVNWRKRKSQGEKLIMIGVALLMLLLISNGPSQVGIRLYPLGVFCFIPMFLILAGILLADFLNLNELLFSRSGIFYSVTFFIALLFLSLAFTIALGLRSEFFAQVEISFYLIMAVFSLISILLLAITIAGINPRSKVNQLAAAFLFSVGILEIAIVLSAIKIPVLYFFRIQQIIYMLFVFAPALALHAIYSVYRMRVPRYVYAVDVLAVICSVLTLTPYYYRGIYNHSFGIFAAAGPGSDVFAALSTFVIGAVIFIWNRKRKTDPNKQAMYIVLAFILLGFLLLTGVPALQGVDVLPLSGMLIVPAGVLTYGLSKHGPLTVRGRAFAINRRMAVFLVLFLMVAMTLVYVILREEAQSRAGILYSLFLLIPLFLFGYLILFLFTKPLTMDIDSSFDLLDAEKKKSNELLLNILPETIAAELKIRGEVEPLYYDAVTILFTDIVGFTESATQMQPQELIEQLNRLFFQFDAISSRYNIEKIKTIGDAYMAAGGLPQANQTHALDVCLAAIEIRQMMEQLLTLSHDTEAVAWQLRIGIHTGPVMAGVVGQHKYAYDIFGDAVNVASRMESTGVAGAVNISADTFAQVKYFFDCTPRGSLPIKNHGNIEMYLLMGLKARYADANGIPNERFREIYKKLRAGARLVPRTQSAGFDKKS